MRLNTRKTQGICNGARTSILQMKFMGSREHLLKLLRAELLFVTATQVVYTVLQIALMVGLRNLLLLCDS